jgi:glutathione S-transferase
MPFTKEKAVGAAHPMNFHGHRCKTRNAVFRLANSRGLSRSATITFSAGRNRLMKLYFSPGTCALADHIVLAWIGKPYTLKKVSRDERKEAWFLALNPAGAVPVIEEDGDWVLTQNSAILNYLADKHPEAHLGGDGIRGRAEVNRWLGIVNSDVHPAFKPLFGTTAFLDDAAMIDRTKDNARENLRTLFERIDRQLAGRDWLVGERSIADPYLFVTLRWAKAQNVDLSGLGNIERFFSRMSEDAGVKRALAEQEAA